MAKQHLWFQFVHFSFIKIMDLSLHKIIASLFHYHIWQKTKFHLFFILHSYYNHQYNFCFIFSFIDFLVLFSKFRNECHNHNSSKLKITRTHTEKKNKKISFKFKVLAEIFIFRFDEIIPSIQIQIRQVQIFPTQDNNNFRSALAERPFRYDTTSWR